MTAVYQSEARSSSGVGASSSSAGTAGFTSGKVTAAMPSFDDSTIDRYTDEILAGGGGSETDSTHRGRSSYTSDPLGSSSLSGRTAAAGAASSSAISSTAMKSSGTRAMTRHEKVVQSLADGYKIVRVSVPSYNITDDVVVYEVDVTNKRLRWNLWLRFEWFHSLHSVMCEVADQLSTARLPVRLPPFPSKKAKLLHDHFDPHFIENRRVLLENYLVKLLKNKYVRESGVFDTFLTPPPDEEMQAGPTLPSPETVARRMRRAIIDDLAAKRADKASDKMRESKSIDEYGGSSDSNSSHNDDSSRKKSKKTSQRIAEDRKRADEYYNMSEAELLTPIPFWDVDESDEITGVTIPTAQILKNDHTIYQIHLVNCNERKSFSEWVVLKRYGDFSRFHEELLDLVERHYPMELHRIPPLPPKFFKPLIDHLEETFIEKRRILLQCYLKRLLQHATFRRLELTLVFLGAFS